MSALPDLCIITRPVGEPVLNQTTGDLDPGTIDTIYTGPCRVRPPGAQEEETTVGDLHETLGRYVATLPALATAATTGDPNDIRVDDYLTVTSSSDAAIIGRAFQVIHVNWGAWQIDRRLGLRDREQPQGVEVGS